MGRPRSVLLVRLVLAGALVAALSPAGAQERVVAISDPGPRVETSGIGERRIPPDRASVNLLVESKAPEAAAAAAREDAEVLARSLGGTLGPLLGSSTSGGGVDPRRMVQTRMDVSGMAYSTQIAPNEIVVTTVVMTRWRFVPNR